MDDARWMASLLEALRSGKRSSFAFRSASALGMPASQCFRNRSIHFFVDSSANRPPTQCRFVMGDEVSSGR
jgi:hypothetical protein